MTSIAQNRESDQREIAGTLKIFFTAFYVVKRYEPKREKKRGGQRRGGAEAHKER